MTNYLQPITPSCFRLLANRSILVNSSHIPKAEAGPRPGISISMRFLLTTLSLLILAAIVWLTLETSPRMTAVPWIPRFIARWADAEPTFRNFPPYALATLLSTLTALA